MDASRIEQGTSDVGLGDQGAGPGRPHDPRGGPSSAIDNRVTALLGVRWPIVQAPMGYIARSPLAAAVSEAGGMGIIETSSGQLEVVGEEMAKMRQLTDRPFGVNLAQLFVKDPGEVVDTLVRHQVRFVTTSAGDPKALTGRLKSEGMTVFHVVPSLRGALKAVEAGVDGLIVEGNEGGGFKHPRGASTMVVLPLVRQHVDVPLIAAGGIADGRSMAAAFVLGAEGVQMGTRMVASAESPIHDNWKQAIVGAAETDTVLLNRFSRPGIRALVTERTAALERQAQVGWSDYGDVADLYFGGNLEAAVPFSGQVAGRIEAIEPVRRILERTMEEFTVTMQEVAARYCGPS